MGTNEHKTLTFSLDDIVRELPQYKNNEQDTIGKQVIIVERETGEILDEIPFFKLFKKLRFFEINRQKVVFNVRGPELSVNYSNSPFPLVLKIRYDAKVSDKGVFNLIRSVYKSTSPIEGVNNILKEAVAVYVFERKDFVNEFKKYEIQLEEFVVKTGLKCGLELRPKLDTNINGNESKGIEQFISFEHKVLAKTKDAQVVEIDHDLALTLTDSIKYKLSGITDIKTWARSKLDQFTNNEIIEMTYAEVLVSMQDSVIKHPMQEACWQIGYELKQLITVPGLDIEKFYFETAEENISSTVEFGTKDTRLKISLNIIVDGRLDLHNEKTKKYIKPGFDIIAGMKKNVVEYAKVYINDITPDECFTYQFEFEQNLAKLIRSKLESTYGFKDLGVTIKFLENDLSKRLSLLQERPGKVEILGDWTERKYALWFRVLTVSKDGWFRFRANNYKTTTEELNDIARMVKNRMESAILRTGDEITGKIISTEFYNARSRVRQEFGLDINIHDFNEDLSDEELLFAKIKKDEIDERYNRAKMIQQGENNQLEEYLKKKEDAIAAEENEEVIRKIDERIAAINDKHSSSKERFLKQKTDADFLLLPDVLGKDRLDIANEDEPKNK